MTKIAYISGIPGNEVLDRSRNLAPQVYIPYTRMTKGEVVLALNLERARVLSSFYPEVKAYQMTETMLENALYSGINNGVHFVGAIPNDLQPVARLIQRASRNTAPASKYAIPRSTPGIAINAPIVPEQYANVDCKTVLYEKIKEEYNKKPRWQRVIPFPPKTGYHTMLMNHPIKKIREWYSEQYLQCVYTQEVERILNNNLERSSMHMLYHTTPATFEPLVGTLAATKRLLHRAGVSDIARIAGVDNALMTSWVEIGTTRSAVAKGIKPLTSWAYTAMLTPDPEKWIQKTDIKTRGGAAIGEPVTVATVTALVVAIGAAITAAQKLAAEFNAKKIQALQNAQGFGTDAFSPEKADFMKAKGDTTLTPPKEEDNTLLWLGGGLAAAYFLSK